MREAISDCPLRLPCSVWRRPSVDLCPNPSVSLRPAAVAPQHLAVFLVRVAIGEPLASRTSIDILVSDVDEVLLAKRPSDSNAFCVAGSS